MSVVSPAAWDEFLTLHPDHHFLQSTAWGKLKASFGWQPVHVVCGEIGAQVLFRRLPLGFSVGYLGKGPVVDPALPSPSSWQPLWEELDQVCHQHKAVFLKVEPDMWEEDPSLPPPFREGGVGEVNSGVGRVPPPEGFHLSHDSIQPLRTLVVDLHGSEEQVLGRMKQKTRYNVRLAQRRGVVVNPSGDLELFNRLMLVTGERDSFGVHSAAYYSRAYELFHAREQAEILVAELEGEPLAALFVLAHGKRAYYLYGASSNLHRDAMPTYLVQWEAMLWARRQGCLEYDLWGVPDADEETLEAGFNQRSDGLWGVYRFKRGFGGELRRAVGPWDRVYNAPLYQLYRWWTARRGGE